MTITNVVCLKLVCIPVKRLLGTYQLSIAAVRYSKKSGEAFDNIFCIKLPEPTLFVYWYLGKKRNCFLANKPVFLLLQQSTSISFLSLHSSPQRTAFKWLILIGIVE